MPGARMFRIVVMKLIAPMIDDAPAMWSAKIAKETDILSGCVTDSGG